MEKFRSTKWYNDYRIFTHEYVWDGQPRKKRYIVRRDGTVENENTERPLKKILRKKTLASGIDVSQVQIRLPEKFYNYGRVVAAAWYEFFDINDLNQVVKFRNGNRHDFRPINLYVTERATKSKYLTEMQQRAIRWIRNNEKGKFGRKPSYRMLAKLYKVSSGTIGKVIKETY